MDYLSLKTFTTQFNEDINAQLLKDYQRLIINCVLNNDLYSIPDNIISIYIVYIQNVEIIFLPNKLEHLEINSKNFYKINYFPETLKSLSLITNDDSYRINMLPNFIEELRTNINFSCKELNYFKFLKHLTISNIIFNKELDCLPNSLECLEIYSHCFNQPLNNLPMNLKNLSILLNRKGRYTQTLDNLPIHLKILKIDGYCAVDNLDNLPNELEYLYISYGATFNISLNNLPNSLVTIEFGSNELLKLNDKTFIVPDKCQTIIYNSNTNLDWDNHKFLLTKKIKIINKYYN